MLQLTGVALNLSQPSPIKRGGREYSAFLRGPVGGEVARFGTVQKARDGAWPHFPISVFPEPTEGGSAEFGILESGGFTVESAMPPAGQLIDAPDNKAVLLNGASEYVVASVPSVLNFGMRSFTIVMRVRHDDFTYPRTSFACQKNGVPWNSAAGWGIGASYLGSGQYLFFSDGTNFVGGHLLCDDGFQPSQLKGTFVDLAIIVDRKAGKVTQVINGVKQSAQMNISAIVGSMDNALGFALGTSIGWLTCGAQDEFQAWDRALTVAEVQSMRRKRLTGKEHGLVTYWTCDEGTGNTIQDKSRSANHGTKIATATWVAGASMDAQDRHRQIEAALRNQSCLLELVTTLKREDGTSVEIAHQRVAKCRSATRTAGGVSLDFVSLDLAALDAKYPSETYTVEDFPELFADHVGRIVPDARGTVVKLPMTEIVVTGGLWKFGFLRVTAGVPVTVLTVYRDGQIVNPVQYTVGTVACAVSPFSVHTINFDREQMDTKRRRYVLTVDVLVGSASTLASEEVRRLLIGAGLTVNAASFDEAVPYGNANLMFADPAYVRGRTRRASIQDLLLIARSDLRQNAAGAWVLVQDRPREPVGRFVETADDIQVDSLVWPELEANFILEYRPGAADEEKYTQTRTRGASGAERRFKNPFLRQHATADRLIDYLAKRATQCKAAAVIHAVQLENADAVLMGGTQVWDGQKKLIVSGVSRTVDSNQATLREYSDAVHEYTPAALPANATNGYTPDYSQTPPAAPSVAPSYIAGSSSTDVDKDGKITANAMIRLPVSAVPTVNVAKVFAVILDTVSNGQHAGELLLNVAGTDYELRFPNLRVNRPCQVFAQCESPDGLKSAPSALTSFTTPNNTALPGLVGGLNVTQDNATSLRVFWTHSALPNRAGYILERSDNGGATWGEVARLGKDTNVFVDQGLATGFTYYYRVRQVDQSGNEGANSTPVSNTVSSWVNWVHITTGGIINSNMGSNSVGNSNVINAAITGAKTDVFSSVNNFFGVGAGAVIQLTSNQGLWSTMSLQQFTCVGGGGPSNTRWRNDGGTTNVTAYENYWS